MVFAVIIANRKSFVVHERASGLVLGWDRSPFDGEDCVGLGVIDLGAFLPVDFPFGLDSFPLPFLPLDASCSSDSHLIVIPFFLFIRPHGLIPLHILGFWLDWTRPL